MYSFDLSVVSLPVEVDVGPFLPQTITATKEQYSAYTAGRGFRQALDTDVGILAYGRQEAVTEDLCRQRSRSNTRQERGSSQLAQEPLAIMEVAEHTSQPRTEEPRQPESSPPWRAYAGSDVRGGRESWQPWPWEHQRGDTWSSWWQGTQWYQSVSGDICDW